MLGGGGTLGGGGGWGRGWEGGRRVGQWGEIGMVGGDWDGGRGWDGGGRVGRWGEGGEESRCVCAGETEVWEEDLQQCNKMCNYLSMDVYYLANCELHSHLSPC